MPQQEYQIITAITVTIIVFLIIGFFIVILFAYVNQRKKRHLEEKQKMKLGFQQELLKSQLEIQEQTLKYISQEIHDNIGQVLSLAKLNLGTTDVTRPETAQQKIEDSKILVSKAIQDLRDLSKSLNTDFVAEMGFARSVEYEMEMTRKTGSFIADFEIEGKVYKLETQKELILFRIVQEALNNIIKHSKATTIYIKLIYELERFTIKINDDGQGFDLNTLKQNNQSGLGIKNMFNRAQMIGCDFNINSTLAKGTTVNIAVPLLISRI
jgi:two-component system, NarL family, sensor kinase